MNQDTIEPNQTHLPNKPPRQGLQKAVANYFQFDYYKTSFPTEILAGVTTFMTMAYILVVNSIILSDAIFLNEPKDLFPQLVVSTALAAGIGTLIMALLARYPFALASGMGTNAFLAYSVVLGLGIDWRVALACVFLEGVIFLVLSVTNVRHHLITAVPSCIKSATTVGIGLFLAYIGLGGDTATGGAGLIVLNEVTKTDFGSFAQPQTLMAVFGIFFTAFLMVRRVTGALLWGMIGTALLGWIFGVATPPEAIASIPPFPTDLFGAALTGLTGINSSNFIDFVAVLFVFLFVDMFDTIGTLAGVGMQGGYIDEKGELPRANQALTADAIATTTGAMMGTSTVTTFVESAAGIAQGGRTGFTALIVAILFFGALFFTPVFAAIPPFATTPALTIIGVLMMGSVATINWEDLTEAIPAFLTIFFIPFAFSIAAGLSVGLIAYPLMKAFQGKAKDVSVVTWVLAVVFIARFVFMTVRFG